MTVPTETGATLPSQLDISKVGNRDLQIHIIEHQSSRGEVAANSAPNTAPKLREDKLARGGARYKVVRGTQYATKKGLHLPIEIQHNDNDITKFGYTGRLGTNPETMDATDPHTSDLRRIKIERLTERVFSTKTDRNQFRYRSSSKPQVFTDDDTKSLLN